MADKRSILEKLLALANDKCNSFESAMAYKMYLKLKDTLPEEEAIKKANEEAEKEWNAYDESTWSEDERREYDYWHDGKFFFDRVDEFLDIWSSKKRYSKGEVSENLHRRR